MRLTPLRVVLVVLVVALGVVVLVDARRGSTPTDSPFACPPPAVEPLPARSPQPVPGVRLASVVEDIDVSTIAPLPGGDVLVGERSGRIGRLDAQGELAPFLDLGPLAVSGEGGLLGLAVAPDGEHLYASHAGEDAHRNVVVEHRLDGGRPVPGSEREILELENRFQIHYAGHLEFGPDGYLWIGVGDGGAAPGELDGDPDRVAQDPGSLRGKLLRIDPAPQDESVPYEVPPDNAFVDVPGARPEVHLVGLRNPWRFSFDDAGGLWLTDVGQFCAEEINYLQPGAQAGANLGWSAYEGNLPYYVDEAPEDALFPVWTYPRGAVPGVDGAFRCAVIGGVAYDGEQLPDLRGRYLFGDFCSGLVEVLDLDDGSVSGQVLTGLPDGGLQTIGAAADGTVYVGATDGLYRLEPDDD